MNLNFLKYLHRSASLAAVTGLLLAVVSVELVAAPKPLSCSITPDGGTATAGVPIQFTGMTQGGKGQKSYLWDFSDGSGVPGASTDTTVAVTYSTVGGPFAVLLDVSTSDESVSCSTTVTVIDGGGGNTPPIANDNTYTTDKDTALNVAAPGVLGNDTDIDGDPLTAVLDTNVSSGSLTLNANGSVDYTPNAGFTGQDSFSYFAHDGTEPSASAATVTIFVIDTGGNAPPIASPDSYSTDMNTELNVVAPGVLSNDSDPDGDPITAVLATDVSNGSLILNADGSLSYTPNTDFTGQDSFSYFAHDGTQTSVAPPATVTIDVIDTTPSTPGEDLFRAKCLMCHGEYGAGGYAHRSVRGARADRIRNAMTKWPEMAFLQYLTDAELNDIETYLASVPRGDRLPRNGDVVNGEAQFRTSCTYCHSYGGAPIEPPRPGPDLMNSVLTMSDTWLGAWIDFPAEMVAAGAYDEAQLANYPYLMPDLLHPPADVWDMVDFLVTQGSTPITDTPPKALTPEEFEASRQDYFNLCAGCHGLYRTGATGPDIGAARSQAIGTDGLRAIITYGTPAGMGNFGQTGILTAQQITDLAAYLQLPPPDAPPLPMADIQASWDLVVPVASRPTAPQHSRNWQNFTGVVLRDAGQVAIFDGDTNEEIARLSTGFAVHILRSSSSGRYFYAIGRDGLVTMIDLWSTVPTIVANVKGCHDARSIDASKYNGLLGNFEDTYLIEGCYWPPQYVVYDGLTLEPKQRVDLPMTDINGQPLVENRVASIVASHNDPVWVVSQKEAGYVSIVDYGDEIGQGFPIVANIATAKFLHDGGFDHTGDYFLVAANASNKMVVVDLVTQSLAALIDTDAVPHPGRGVNWFDPDYGWVNATSHIGAGRVLVYGADPVGRPDVAWQVVRDIALPSAGSLFIKSHPNSPWVLVDMTLSATGDEKDICAISKATGALDRCFQVASNGRAVHFEFNMDGSEVMVSDWDPNGAVIVLDGTTLNEVRRFVNLQTPTGKFNVYNTAHDIY
jgi:nitrite reductase (NO-forming)/hydroxylamine reductase